MYHVYVRLSHAEFVEPSAKLVLAFLFLQHLLLIGQNKKSWRFAVANRHHTFPHNVVTLKMADCNDES